MKPLTAKRFFRFVLGGFLVAFLVSAFSVGLLLIVHGKFADIEPHGVLEAILLVALAAAVVGLLFASTVSVLLLCVKVIVWVFRS